MDSVPINQRDADTVAHLDTAIVTVAGIAVKRAFWFCLGILSLSLAFAGVALPLLPTTPFLLVAAFAFARSSSRMHAWLINHKVFGPLIENWRDHGAISKRAKMMSVISLAAVFMISLVLNASTLVLAIQAVVLSASGAFILSRPSGPG
ncbi:MAG: YbaN family protein [Pseudomonadota bacterium]